MLSVEFSNISENFSGSVVVGAFEERLLSSTAQKLNDLLNGALLRALKLQKFSGKAGELCVLLAPSDEIDQIVVVGLGKESVCTRKILEEAGGRVSRSVRAECADVFLDPLPQFSDIPGMIFAEGAMLGSWEFDKYRTKKPESSDWRLKCLRVAVADPNIARKAFLPVESRVRGTCTARSLAAEPANVLYPESFAERAAEVLQPLGVQVEILDKRDIEKLGMGALLGVAQGSVREPRIVVLEWKGTAAKCAPVAFVGKGLTFDSGGIDLKPQQGMEEMIYDMSGAGVVFGLFEALALKKARAHAVGILALAENMPSGSAQRPGDIVKTLSGKTVEVLNTDAEGRLVLADALWYACERFSPEVVVDLATLTGAIVSALGGEFAGLFSNADALAEHLTSCGEEVGEKLWRLPMTESFDKDIDSSKADLKNLGTSGQGGSITAAHFLKRFVKEGVAWAHLDIAGASWARKDTPIAPKGPTGFGVRLLEAYVRRFREET